MNWYVYILECSDGRLYTGITNDLKRRWQQHQTGKGARFTRAFKVKRLVFSKTFRSRSQALKAEFRFKQLSRLEKMQLIQTHQASLSSDS